VASGLPGSGSFSPVFLSEPDPSPRAPCSASSVGACARGLRVATAHPFLPLYLSPSPFYSSLSSKRKLLPPPAIAAPPRAPVTRRHTPSLPSRSHQKVRAHLLPLPELTTPPSTIGADRKSCFPHRRLEHCCHLTGLRRAPSCRQRRRPPHWGPHARAAASHEPANHSSRAAVAPLWKPFLSRALSSFAVHAAP
jgi:hypothetical protein